MTRPPRSPITPWIMTSRSRLPPCNWALSRRLTLIASSIQARWCNRMWQPAPDVGANVRLEHSGMPRACSLFSCGTVLHEAVAAFVSSVLEGAVMHVQEQSDLVLSCARVLHVNGQSTDETLAATERIGNSLGLRAKIIPHWGELQLQVGALGTIAVAVGAANPTGVDMNRVASAMRVIDEVGAGRLARPAALKVISAIAQAPPAPTWLFTLAAAAGAAALALLFGVQHLAGVALIMASAALGAMLRRTLARYSTNPLLQPFCAALLAGMLGALAVHYQLSSSLRLVAVCPCMILVPGPHVLNGMLDLAAARVS